GVACWVLGISVDRNFEEGAFEVEVNATHETTELFMSSCRADRRQCGSNGRAAECLNPIFSHEGPVKGPHLSLQILWLMVRALRCLLHDFAKLHLGEIIDKHVNGYARLVNRYGCSSEPASIGKFEEVVTRLDRGILPGNIEAPGSKVETLPRIHAPSRGR